MLHRLRKQWCRMLHRLRMHRKQWCRMLHRLRKQQCPCSAGGSAACPTSTACAAGSASPAGSAVAVAVDAAAAGTAGTAGATGTTGATAGAGAILASTAAHAALGELQRLLWLPSLRAPGLHILEDGVPGASDATHPPSARRLKLRGQRLFNQALGLRAGHASFRAAVAFHFTENFTTQARRHERRSQDSVILVLPGHRVDGTVALVQHLLFDLHAILEGGHDGCAIQGPADLHFRVVRSPLLRAPGFPPGTLRNWNA